MHNVATLVILGSGMSDCFAPEELDFIEGNLNSTVQGHPGKLALLKQNRSVLLSLGRRHLYEGWSLDDVQQTVRRAGGLGARNLIVTNAAGGLNPIFRTGEIMLIQGCLSLMMGAWLVRKEGERSQRELPTGIGTPAFSVERYPSIVRQALERGVGLRSGIYAAVTGPGYETRAEIRMHRRIGADAVGMSTVAEVAAARELGMRVVGLSLITNRLSDSVIIPLDHADVVEQGLLAGRRMRLAIEAALAAL
jgi:purine-nucleoside phosphorylase